MIISVYLDTNILIQGAKRPEHHKLIKLSEESKIRLFFSIKNDLEMHGKVLPLRRKKDMLSPLTTDFDSFKNAIKDYEDALHAEEQDWNFWKQAKLMRTLSTFNGLLASGPFAMQVDMKGELGLWEELVEKYKIGNGDAVHLMHAHSASLNYFLTWDKSLINKTKNIKWLNCNACTPKELLKKII